LDYSELKRLWNGECGLIEEMDVENGEDRGGDPSKNSLEVSADTSKIKQTKIRKGYLRHNCGIHNVIVGKKVVEIDPELL
jgi:hypothetical protein